MESSIVLAQDNRITLSRYDFTPIEKRCLYYVIKEIRRIYVDRDLREHETVYQDIFSDMYLNIKAENLKMLGDEVKDVYNALRKLRERTIEIDNEEIWAITAWILKARHIKSNDTYEVLVSSEILPYMVELASQFTTYSLTVAITLKSTYSQRLYEICCMYRNKGKFFIEVDKLRYMLKVEAKKTYENAAALKRGILDVAQKELKALFDAGQCDLFFTYRIKEHEKRKIKAWWFDIHTIESEEEKRLHFENTQAQIRRIMEICRTFIKRDDKYLSRLLKELNFNPSNASEILDKLNNKVMDYSKKELPAIIRYVLREDYGIK
jgi:plasmid replication initiation protein